MFMTVGDSLTAWMTTRSMTDLTWYRREKCRPDIAIDHSVIHWVHCVTPAQWLLLLSKFDIFETRIFKVPLFMLLCCHWCIYCKSFIWFLCCTNWLLSVWHCSRVHVRMKWDEQLIVTQKGTFIFYCKSVPCLHHEIDISQWFYRNFILVDTTHIK